MKRDAFDVVVERIYKEPCRTRLEVQQRAAKLLRAQHRAFVRMVEKVEYSQVYGETYKIACKKIKAALAAKGKGGKR